ncbi:MAG: hypothetical protein ACRYFS_14760 [Janthinobacterium lividum]
MRCFTAIAALLLLSSVCSRLAWADNVSPNVNRPSVQYTIADLGSIGGLLITPSAINDLGQVVGSSQFPDGTTQAFLWQKGKITPLKSIQGDQTSVATAINNKGQIVGVSRHTAGAIHGVLWDKGSAINLGSLGSGSRDGGSVTAINDAGQILVNEVTYLNNNDTIVAQLDPAQKRVRVLLCTINGLQGGKLLGQSILLGQGITVGIAISHEGVIIGYQYDPQTKHLHGCLWKDGVVTALGNFYPSAINAKGQIAGTLRNGPRQVPTAAFWQNGIVTPLHFSGSSQTRGIALNDKEEILGVTDLVADVSAPHAALLWKDGHSANLSSSLLPKGEWTMMQPTAINNLSQIVGYGLHKGKVSAFLMTPATAGIKPS